MFTDAKILLRIELQGGVLIRENISTKIEWQITLGELKNTTEKKLPQKIGDKIVKSGKSSHYNLIAKPAIKCVNLGKEAYDYIVSADSYEHWLKWKMDKRTYIKLSIEKKLDIHLGRMCEDYGGKSFTYQILD